MSVSNRRGLTLGIMILALALFLAACGTGGTAEDDSDGVASLGTDTTTGPEDGADDTSTVEAPTDRNEAFLRYDQCMAEEGFPTDAASQANDGPTVQEGTAGGSDEEDGPTEQITGPGGIEIAPEDLEAFQAANQVCSAHLANITQGEELTPEQEAALADLNLRVQQCLDEKGIDAQIVISGDDSGGLVDEESSNEAPPPNQGEVDPEAADVAMAECMKIFDEYPELADVLPPPPGS